MWRFLRLIFFDELTHLGLWLMCKRIFDFAKIFETKVQLCTPRCHWHCGVKILCLVNRHLKTCLLYFQHSNVSSYTFYWLTIPLKAPLVMTKTWSDSAVSWKKLRNVNDKKFLSNLEPLHKNDVDNESWVQMSFNHENHSVNILCETASSKQRKGFHK